MNAGEAIPKEEDPQAPFSMVVVDVEAIKMAKSEIVSPFKETKERIKTLCKSSRFGDSLTLVENYLKENSLDDATIDEKSKVYLRYLIVAQKMQNLKLVGHVYQTYIKPTLAESTCSVIAHSRMLYALQRISTAL
jgi:hypothetical protein